MLNPFHSFRKLFAGLNPLVLKNTGSTLARLIAIVALSFGFTMAALAADATVVISELIQPARLATLRARGANPRVQKCVYWLATARETNQNPTNLLDSALALAGYTNAPVARLTRDALLRNLDIAEKLGCLDADGLAEMRKGKAPTIRNGPYRGDQLSVDHIIPRAVCPELDNVIANLELLPMRMNSSKNDRVGDRQLSLAKDFQQAGLLPLGGMNKIQTAALRHLLAKM